MEMKKKAKKDALESMKKKFKDTRMSDMMGKMDDMKKVTVMSDSEEGLEEGLTKAQQIMKMKEDKSGSKYKDGGYGKETAEGSFYNERMAEFEKKAKKLKK